MPPALVTVITHEPALTITTAPVEPTVHIDVSAEDHESEPVPVPPEPVTVALVRDPNVPEVGFAVAVKVAWFALLIVMVTDAVADK